MILWHACCSQPQHIIRMKSRRQLPDKCWSQSNQYRCMYSMNRGYFSLTPLLLAYPWVTGHLQDTFRSDMNGRVSGMREIRKCQGCESQLRHEKLQRSHACIARAKRDPLQPHYQCNSYIFGGFALQCRVGTYIDVFSHPCNYIYFPVHTFVL